MATLIGVGVDMDPGTRAGVVARVYAEGISDHVSWLTMEVWGVLIGVAFSILYGFGYHVREGGRGNEILAWSFLVWGLDFSK